MYTRAGASARVSVRARARTFISEHADRRGARTCWRSLAMPSKSRTSSTSCCAVSRDRCPSPPIIAHPPRVIALYRYRLPFGNAYPESPVSVAADSILRLVRRLRLVWKKHVTKHQTRCACVARAMCRPYANAACSMFSCPPRSAAARHVFAMSEPVL